LKPRLLIILNRLAIGGPAMNTLALAQALSDEYDILCIAGKPLPHEHSAEHLLNYYKGFKVELINDFRRELFLSKDIAAYKKIKSVIKVFKPHIVHTHGSKPGILGRWAAYRLKVPLIIHTYHGHVFQGYFPKIISQLIVLLERRMSVYTNMIIAINRQLLHDLSTTYKIAGTGKIKLIPLGLDVHYYEKSMQKSAVKDINKNKDIIIVGIIGRLVPVKQHRLFIRLAIRLLKEHTSKPFKFYIVGDGPERENLIDMVADAGYDYVIGEDSESAAPFHFLLWRTDIPHILSCIDILLHTSVNEGTPVSILEAMAMGKPVVSTPVGGIPELFQQAETGYCALDEHSLLKKVLELAETKEMRGEWGEKGKKYILEKLTIEAQAAVFRQELRPFSFVNY
jgi:glycosyltransferase involved in cell wall biosynthesis